MARSLVAFWGTLFVAITAISVLAQFWIRQREQNATERVRSILKAQLEPINESIVRVVDSYSISLQRQLSGVNFGNLKDCVEVTRSPLAQAVVVVNRDAELHFPADIQRENTNRRSLIDEAQQLLREQGDPRPVARRQAPPAANPLRAAPVQESPIQESPVQGRMTQEDTSQVDFPTPPADNSGLRSRSYRGAGNVLQEPATQQSANAQPQLAENVNEPVPAPNAEEIDQQAGAENFGWITWYHRRGMVLGFWWHQAQDWRTIVVLPRARWMADIVAALPDAALPDGKGPMKQLASPSHDSSITDGSIMQLVDVEGNLIYQWGNAPREQWDTLSAGESTAELPVANPLEGWRLRIYASADLSRQLAGDDMVVPIWAAVGGIAAALLLGGLLVTINLNRQVRLAKSRVSFVNQVSHELRTPLTNICMYADLLAGDMERHGDQPGQLERIGIIQNESRRLTRLISNVLEFARSGSKTKQLRKSARVLDDLVREVLATFQPRLDELCFTVSVRLDTPEVRSFDPDAIEQILVNLIGNAEKYASEGKRLTVETSGTPSGVEIYIEDDGPGVPRRMAQKIFSPFERLSDRLEAPAGTGIGLTIVRELARKHGGDCWLVDSEKGAAFRVRLEASLVQEAD